MIELQQVSVTYPDASKPTLRAVDLKVAEGELCLVVGTTGSGKSTLLRTINGLVPHFTGGTLTGRVLVAGRDTATHRPRDLADVVGVVGQDPTSGFVADVVEQELAYGMETLGLPADVMRRRVEETLDLLGLAELRDRALITLSGGQRQRVAIGAVLTANPSILVLDEPTSALDPTAAEEVLATLHRLVHDLGITVLMAEHRLERVIHLADRVVYLPGGGAAIEAGSPHRLMATIPIAPPVVELGRKLGWDPLALTVRDARRRASDLRHRLEVPSQPREELPSDEDPLATTRGLVVTYGPIVALAGVDLHLRRGEIVALMGRNGSGKSTLLNTLTGIVRPTAGEVRVQGSDPTKLRPRQLIGRVGMVPQQPGDLLYAPTVGEECSAADRDAGVADGSCRTLLEELVPGLDPTMHPQDLSEGQRLSLVLAVVLTSAPPLVLLDEPTRGLDYAAKDRLVTALRSLAAQGHGIVLATHDVELAAAVADRTIVLAEGEVVVDGPTPQVVTSSPAFAPQVAKVFAPLELLTVTAVTEAIEKAPA